VKLFSPTTIIYSISKCICWLAIAALAAMMLITFSDVVLRYFGRPIKGAYDVVGLLGAAVVALPIAYTQIKRGHIAIEFLVSKVPRRTRTFIDILNHLLNVFFYSLLVWQSSLYGKKLLDLGRVSETIQIPIFPFAYTIAFGCSVMCLVLIVETIQLLKELVKK